MSATARAGGARRVDAVVGAALRAAGTSAVVLLGLIVVFVAVEAAPSVSALGGRWLTDGGWRPAPEAADGEFLLVPMVAGTLLTTLGALVLAAPLGIGCAAFLRFYAPRPLAGGLARILELLAGAPSVLVGLFGLTCIAPLVRRVEPPGQSLLTGVLVLALMVVPTVALLADAAFRALPRAWTRGAAALGLSRWETLRGLALPACARSLAAAVLLGAARAVGETMAVLMVCGNVVQVPRSLFDPVRTLTANIALELSYATGVHRSALFASGLVATGVVGLLVAATARLVAEREGAR